ncbi:MAG: hypothetical protein AAF519_03875 [Bacteroidota bacterium]
MQQKPILLYFLTLVIACQAPTREKIGTSDALAVDFRYQPREWQTCYGLKDDLYKSMIADDGSLWYGFQFGTNHIGFPYPNYCWERNKGYSTALIPQFINQGYPDSLHQVIESEKLPIVHNYAQYGNLSYAQTTFASFKDSANPLDSRYDVFRIKMQNLTAIEEKTQLRLEINTTFQVRLDESKTKAYLILYGEDDQLLVQFSRPVARFAGHVSKMKYSYYLDFEPVLMPARASEELSFIVPRSQGLPQDVLPISYDSEIKKIKEYWNNLELPYDKIIVPDSGIQALLNSSVRNIYQAREIKENIPAFQVGPTFYRGTWAVDGPFFMEAMTYLGQENEVRKAIEGIFKVGETQGDTGESFAKQAGLRLWMVWRHAQLTEDDQWLEGMWQFIEQEVENIKRYRANSYKDGNPLTDGMMPKGNSDGGIGGIYAEYTNNYWVLSGLKMAIHAARQLAKEEQAVEWQQFFDDYFKTFNKARNRDKQIDQYGNTYVPTFMGHNTLNPTTGQWAFMHSIFPGKLYENDDRLMLGTLAMLDSSLVEGLILGTGWLPKGLWTYSASFHGHSHLWLGNGERVPQILYDFANHASPLLCWSEEQHPVDFKGDYLAHGDMPHNWASVDFIRLVRHSLALERGDELHLFEGLPKGWLKAGMVTSFNAVNTTFGKLTFQLKVTNDGTEAILDMKLERKRDRPPAKIVIHQDVLNGSNEKIEKAGENEFSMNLVLN